MRQFIERLPKAELHIHLVGAASLPTVLGLAARYPDSPVPRTEAGLRAFYQFRDFAHFIDVYHTVSDLLREPEDVADLVRGIARDLAAQNVRYAELTVTPYAFVQRGRSAGRTLPPGRGLPPAAVTEALDIAAREAATEIAYIFDIDGGFGAEAARVTLDHALSHPPAALVGFGIGGPEAGRDRDRDEFRDAFAAAVAAGLHSVPHAGEATGPPAIWEALDHLHAERIGHGINCLADPRLVARLRATQVPLEVCPTSNVCTGQVRELASHPLPRLLAEGLFVTLNSDDPPMFGTSLNAEYERAAEAFGLTEAQLTMLALNAVRASFLPHPRKQELLDLITNIATSPTPPP
jgi:aminodeoxyfutalosine deaminase